MSIEDGPLWLELGTTTLATYAHSGPSAEDRVRGAMASYFGRVIARCPKTTILSSVRKSSAQVIRVISRKPGPG